MINPSLPTNKQLLPLHTHTVYSVLDGASTIDEYLKWCKENGASALGITDHGWMIGGNELITKSLKEGIAPLPGCEFYVVPPVDYKFAKKPYDYYHVTAWAVNEKGYRNLLKLGSISFGTEEGGHWGYSKEGKPKGRVVSYFGGMQRKPRITFEELFQYNEGLVLGTGCLIGALNKAYLHDEKDGAERNLQRLLSVYKDRLFVEIMPHAVTHDWDREAKGFKHNECSPFAPDGDIQKSCNNCSIEIAEKYKLPLLMTVDSHFVKKEQYELQKVLLQNGNPSGWHFKNSYHMLSTAEAWENWKNINGDDKAQRLIFGQAVDNNHLLADMAKQFRIKDEFQQPEVVIDADLKEAVSDEKKQLKLQIMRAVEKHGRMQWGNPDYESRLKRELDTICDNGIHDFAKYFLFLEQWQEWTRAHSILSAPGRGSGAGSLLCYLLKITHLDPFTNKLPFERFLSMGRLRRGKFPDIDWDLGEREPLLAKLAEVYGDRFAQCSTHGTLKIKSAIKDASRIMLGQNAADDRVTKITKPIPITPMGVSDKDFLLGYESEGIEYEGYIDQDMALKAFFDEHPDVFDAVVKLLGVPRSVGRHASAYFISDRPIAESSPTCTVSGHVCTQYTPVWAEKAGLIKFDLLRVNTLLDISNAIRLIQKRAGHKIWKDTFKINGEDFKIWQGDMPVESLPMPDGTILDIYKLPEVEEVFTQFDRGETESGFQVSTPLLTNFGERLQPRKLEDIYAMVALVRPGPLKAKIEDGETTMADAFILRRHGKQKITYAHPDTEPILKDTYGVAVYQEQLQQMFSDLAGYTPEEADEMREKIAKKKRQDMEKAIPELKRRLAERKWTENQIEVFVNLCIASAAYSFNRAHSASYGMVAYQSMFLKFYYPLEWWTAVLQNAKVEDIREKGYANAVKDKLVLPHVNGPTDTFDLRDDGKIHSPLYLIDGIGDAACLAIQNERLLNGDFKNFLDFFDRIDRRAVNQGVMHSLIICGMFEQIEPTKTRRELLHEYHYYKRALSLKIGKKENGMPKSGGDLVAAAEAMKIKEPTLDVPELYLDNLEYELIRMRSLPIYRLDIYTSFQKLMEGHKFMFGPAPGVVTYSDGQMKPAILKNFSNVAHFYEAAKMRGRADYPAGWAGLVQSSEEFSYEDKKTKKKVTALKIYLTNDGDTMECVLWPRQYEQKRTIKENTILFCVGPVKPSREPGKWSMSVNVLKEL